MKTKQNLVYMTIAVAIYVANKGIIIPNTAGQVEYFCRCYLNDLVCPLFFLSLCQIVLRWAGCEIKTYMSHLLLVLTAGAVWEFIIPIFKTNAVSDWWDIGCYIIGATVFYLISKLHMNGNVYGEI